MKKKLLLFLAILFIFSGCGKVSTPSTLTIEPLDKPSITLPAVQDIQSLVMIEGGTGANIGLGTNNTSEVAMKIMKWLQDAEPQSVKLPQLHKTIISSRGIPFSKLILHTKEGGEYRIYPANYMDTGYVRQYVKNIVEVDYNQSKSFCKSQDLYEWLMTDKWKKDFTESG